VQSQPDSRKWPKPATSTTVVVSSAFRSGGHRGPDRGCRASSGRRKTLRTGPGCRSQCNTGPADAGPGIGTEARGPGELAWPALAGPALVVQAGPVARRVGPCRYPAWTTGRLSRPESPTGCTREILKSNWGLLERQLAYKAGELVKVDPAYTSQTCAMCQHVDRANRKTQALFHCTACGHTANADHNAALNILARGLLLVRPARGVGASARRGAFPSGPRRPVNQAGRGSPDLQGRSHQAPPPPGVNSSV